VLNDLWDSEPGHGVSPREDRVTYRRQLGVLAVLIVSTTLVASCGPGTGSSDSAPDLEGIILNKCNYTFVAESLAPEAQDHFLVIWKPGRPIVEKVGESDRSVTWQELQPGDRVQVWFTASVLTDEHLQVTATRISRVKRSTEP
jgi:hypothetical protein